MKITITEDADWRPPGLTTHGHFEVSYEQVADGVPEQDLLEWAFDAMSDMVIDDSEDDVVVEMPAMNDVPEFEEGDVVRSSVDGTIGTVIVPSDANGDVHVDWEDEGIMLSRPETLVFLRRRHKSGPGQ